MIDLRFMLGDEIVATQDDLDTRAGEIDLVDGDLLHYRFTNARGKLSRGLVDAREWKIEVVRCGPLDVAAWRTLTEVERTGPGRPCPHISQLELADRLGITERTVQRWETDDDAAPQWARRDLRNLNATPATPRESALIDRIAEFGSETIRIHRIGAHQWRVNHALGKFVFPTSTVEIIVAAYFAK